MATILATHDNGQPALTLDGWELSDDHSVGTIERAQLPQGFDTPEQLAETLAGRAYILARMWGVAEPEDYPEVVERYEVGMVGGPPHPECYVETFVDDSAYVHTNAADEVWADLDDCLDHYGLKIDGDRIVANYDDSLR